MNKNRHVTGYIITIILLLAAQCADVSARGYAYSGYYKATPRSSYYKPAQRNSYYRGYYARSGYGKKRNGLHKTGRHQYSLKQSEVKHYFGLYGEGAYSQIMTPQIGGIVNKHGWAGGGGLLYEMKYHSFLMDIGCGFAWQEGGRELKDRIVYNEGVFSTQGSTDEFLLTSSIQRYDWVRRGFLDIPFMLGGDLGGMYILGGFKMGIGLFGDTKLHGKTTTVGTWDQYFIPITQTANHGFREDVPMAKTVSSAMTRFDIRASLEFGFWLAQVSKQHFSLRTRIGLFADFGLFTKQVYMNPNALERPVRNLTQAEVDAMLNGTYDIQTRYIMNPLVTDKKIGAVIEEQEHWEMKNHERTTASTSGPSMMNNLLVGLKVTILVSGQPDGEKQYCLMCRDHFKPAKIQSGCVLCREVDPQ